MHIEGRDLAETELRERYDMSGRVARAVLDVADEFGRVDLWLDGMADTLAVYAYEDGSYDAFLREV
jgi:hypothetical protein